MKILAFAATNHKKSINRKLLIYCIKHLKTHICTDAKVDLIDLINYELELYRQDREEAFGIPDKAIHFYNKINQSDLLIAAFAEHNGSYTAVYKNLFDWASRINQRVYQGKPIIIMSASPGFRGGAGVLSTIENTAPYFGLDIKATISVPNFQDNFDENKMEITNSQTQKQILDALNTVIKVS
ncbi:MAG: NAD(P)H-dependent oxidoreductase [Pseudomonadota bacterium]